MSAIDPVNAGSYSKAVIDIIRDMGFDGVALAMGFASVGGIIIGAIFVKSGKWQKRAVGLK